MISNRLLMSCVLTICLSSAGLAQSQYRPARFEPRGDTLVTYRQGGSDTECVKHRELNPEQVTKLAARAVFRGYHSACRLVGFTFAQKDTLWVSVDDVVMQDEDAWNAYLKGVGPGINCTRSHGQASTSRPPNNSSSVVRGFCG